MLVKAGNRYFALAAVLAALSVLALAVDMPCARFMSKMGIPGDVRKLFTVSEVFGHGMGIALILIAVAVLDPLSWRKLPRVVCATYGAGLIAQLAKHLLPRLRPNVSDLTADVWQTFVTSSASSQLPLAVRDLQSYPSGHSATAFGLACGLAWLYPRGRWLFVAFAVLAMMQRIESGAHFISDTLAGAAIASLTAGLLWQTNGLGATLASWEAGGPQGDNRTMA